MAFDPVTAILDLGNTILDRVLPDKAANDSAKAALASQVVQGQFAAQIAQLQVNQAEATNQNVFVAGWRPFVGWVCGIAFAYSFIFQPAAQSIAVLLHSSFDVSKLPNLNGSDLSTILFGMLGLGAMRSYDKSQGTGNGH
jgi:hypothetical protein